MQTSGFTALHSIQLPFLASASFPLSFLTLASYLSSLNQVQGCLHLKMQEYRSILAGPMLVIYPVPLRGGTGRKKWNRESSDLLFISCSFWSLSLRDLFYLTLTCLFTCSFLSCLSPHLEGNIYKGRYFCQLFHSDNPGSRIVARKW